MSKTAWRGLFIALVTIAFGIVMYPTYQYYSMSKAAQAAMPKDKHDKLRAQTLNLGLDLQGGAHLVYEVKTEGLPPDQRLDAVDRAIETIRNRIDQIGVGEHVVQKEGTSRVLVQLPGVLDTERAKEIVGRTARLEFKLVKNDSEIQSLLGRLDSFLAARSPADSSMADSTDAGRPFTSLIRTAGGGAVLFEVDAIPAVDAMIARARSVIPGNVSLAWSRETSNLSGKPGRFLYFLENKVDLTGDNLQNAEYAVGVDPKSPGGSGVRLFMTKEGGAIFYRLTRANVNRQLAIVMDNSVYSAPRINDAIKGGEAVITGIDQDQEARDLAVVLRAGALPADMSIVEERTVGPSLGSDSIKQGVTAAWVGAALVIVFMLVYYQGSGLIAVIAMLLNVLYLVAVMVLIGATLTLPGLAGIILTIGMAVDANILVFERIREELTGGKTVRAAVDAGFKRAFLTIFDAHVTTLLTAVALYVFAAGPVKGFGMTLGIGIVLNLFTAVFCSRVMFDAFTERGTAKRLSI
ncbi:MAG TPA: protein translocase subunit SecD [Candidatus Eisenbacteria bacterium]